MSDLESDFGSGGGNDYEFEDGAENSLMRDVELDENRPENHNIEVLPINGFAVSLLCIVFESQSQQPLKRDFSLISIRLFVWRHVFLINFSWQEPCGVAKENRMTTPYMTKYEKTRILGKANLI